jgi:hypothetical protein
MMSNLTVKRSAGVFAIALIVGSWTPVAARASDEAVLAEFYGRGVHQYFAGNYGQAIADLSAAINGGTRDPRAYYFRALAGMNSGQQAQVAGDLRKGAELESADLNQFYPVGKSLERVQGSARMQIERHRSLARAQAFQRRHERDLIRYEQRRRAESQVLRSSASAPLPAPPADLLPKEVAPPEPGPPAEPIAGKVDKKPAANAGNEPSGDELFSEDAPAAEAAPPAAEEAEMPAEDATPETPEENPFADDPQDSK